MKANESIKRLAAKKGIKIKLHNVIYKLIEDLKEELNSKLPPAVVENTIGELSFTVNFLLAARPEVYSPIKHSYFIKYLILLL